MSRQAPRFPSGRATRNDNIRARSSVRIGGNYTNPIHGFWNAEQRAALWNSSKWPRPLRLSSFSWHAGCFDFLRRERAEPLNGDPVERSRYCSAKRDVACGQTGRRPSNYHRDGRLQRPEILDRLGNGAGAGRYRDRILGRAHVHRSRLAPVGCRAIRRLCRSARAHGLHLHQSQCCGGMRVWPLGRRFWRLRVAALT